MVLIKKKRVYEENMNLTKKSKSCYIKINLSGRHEALCWSDESKAQSKTVLVRTYIAQISHDYNTATYWLQI